MPTRAEIQEAIRRIFAARGIDPAVAERVLDAESKLDPAAVGDSGKSYGLGQLYLGGGLGNVALNRGIDPRDPNTWEQQLQFIAEQVATGNKGWEPWHAAKKIGVGDFEGIGGRSATPALPRSADPTPETPFTVTDLSKLARYNRGGFAGPVQGLILHHTGGRGTPESVVNTLNQRGLGVHYVMDRDGKVYQTLPQGAQGAHIKPSERKEVPLSNANAIGIEVIAKNDADITDAQKAAITGFRDYAAKTYGFDPSKVYGHGGINSHKQATEGAALLAVLNGTAPPTQSAGGTPQMKSVPGAVPMPADGVPKLPANVAEGMLASSPFQAVADESQKAQEQTQQAAQVQQAVQQEQLQQLAQPMTPDAPMTPQPQQAAAQAPDYAALMFPRIRRGLLAGGQDYGGLLGGYG